MANAILFKRTDAQTFSTHPTVNDLPDSQKVIFNSSDSRLESIRRPHANNVVDFPVTTQDGTRKSNIQDAGGLNNMLNLVCSFRIDKANAVTQIARFVAMYNQVPMVTTKFPFGNIGFYSPNTSTFFNVDPNASSTTNANYGLTIRDIEWDWDAQRSKTMIIRFSLKIGGTSPI